MFTPTNTEHLLSFVPDTTDYKCLGSVLNMKSLGNMKEAAAWSERLRSNLCTHVPKGLLLASLGKLCGREDRGC